MARTPLDILVRSKLFAALLDPPALGQRLRGGLATIPCGDLTFEGVLLFLPFAPPGRDNFDDNDDARHRRGWCRWTPVDVQTVFSG